jgi:hypothetical protein
VDNCRLGLSDDGFWTPTWFNGVIAGRLTTGGELAKALAAVDTAFWAVARALAISVSDPNPDLESESSDPSPVVLVARPAF